MQRKKDRGRKKETKNRERQRTKDREREKKRNKAQRRQEAMVKWLRQMAHDQEVVGPNPGTVYWMDVSDLLPIPLKKN